MPAVFVHVSDIHFGQERDQRVHIHDDVKQQLIADAGEVVRGLPGGNAQGVLVTGDIAYSGIWAQYEAAGRWLDGLAAEIGCPIHRVQMVPGNHDLDRNKLSVGGKQLLDYIRAGGAEEYEKVFGDRCCQSNANLSPLGALEALVEQGFACVRYRSNGTGSQPM